MAVTTFVQNLYLTEYTRRVYTSFASSKSIARQY